MNTDIENWNRHEPSARRVTRFRPQYSPHNASAADLKANLPTYLSVKGCDPEINTVTNELRSRCPCCHATAPTLVGNLKLDVWQWECTACRKGGTIIDLCAALHGMEMRGAAFHEVLRELNEELRWFEIVCLGRKGEAQQGGSRNSSL